VHSDLEIKAASTMDVDMLMLEIRSRDAGDLQRIYSRPAADALHSMVADSQAWVVYWRGQAAAIFGVTSASILTPDGMPWLVGSKIVDQKPRLFLRTCRELVGEMDKLGYTRLENFTHQDNVVSHRWLRWLGFTIGDRLEGTPYLRFWKDLPDA